MRIKKISGVVFIFLGCYMLPAICAEFISSENISSNENSGIITKTKPTRMREFLSFNVQNLKNTKEKFENFVNQKKEDAFYSRSIDDNTYPKIFVSSGRSFLKYVSVITKFLIHSLSSIVDGTLSPVETASSCIKDIYDSISPIKKTASLGVNLGATIDSGFDYGVQKISEGPEKIGSKILEFENKRKNRELDKLIKPIGKDLNENEIKYLKSLMKEFNIDQQKQLVDLLELYHKEFQQNGSQNKEHMNQELVSTVRTHLGIYEEDQEQVPSQKKKRKKKKNKDQSITTPNISKKSGFLRLFRGKKELEEQPSKEEIVRNFEQLTQNLDETQTNGLRRFIRIMDRKLNPVIERSSESSRISPDFIPLLFSRFLSGNRSEIPVRIEDSETED